MRRHAMCAVAVATAAMMPLGACSLDLKNPNSPTEAEIASSVDNVI